MDGLTDHLHSHPGLELTANGWLPASVLLHKKEAASRALHEHVLVENEADD
jgi:hypothetical protein